MDLPNELLHHVLLELPGLQVPRLRAVCKRWCSIINTSVAIKLLIGFAIDGRTLPNIHRPNVPYNKALEQLYRSNAAWEALMPTFSLNFRVPGKRLTYEVADGLFANGTSENSTERIDKTRAIEFWELPDGVLSTELRNVVNHPDLGVNIVDFSFDRGQDLLIYIEIRGQDQYILHLRTISTNGVHPKATKDRIELPGQLQLEECKFHIWGDSIGCLLQSDWGNTLFIADWPRGVISASYDDVLDFSLLDRDYALLVTADSTEDYFSEISTWSVQPPLTLKLRFPDFNGEICYFIEVLRNCKMAHSTLSHSDAPLSGTLYITDGPDICVISLMTQPEQSEIFELLLVIDRRSLLSTVAPHLHCGDSATAVPSASTTILDWSMWGPQTTRCIPLGNVEVPPLVSGWRVLFWAKPQYVPLVDRHFQQAGLDPGDKTKSRRVALDFNPYRAGLILERNATTDSVLQRHLDDVVECPGFPEPLITTRPCRISVEKAASPDFNELDCCGGTIIDFQDHDNHDNLTDCYGRLSVF